MNWQDLKNKIYCMDGSFRDIYVLNTTRNDWKLFADFINTNYITSNNTYETDAIDKKIDIDKIFEYWNVVRENCSTATIFIGNIKVNVHFFREQEIENDITPQEINSIEDHNKLIDYMTRLSKTLNKKVILTPENMPEIELISVDKDEIKVNLN